jgi:drug/metabolite transporter (DMT)-like permease
MSDFGSEQSVFAAVAFLIGAVAAFVIMPKTKALPTKGFALTGVGSGIMLGVVNVINVHVSGVLPGIIVFPTVNGGSIIVSAILARIFLGEKISLRKKIGIAVGVAAICLIAL